MIYKRWLWEAVTQLEPPWSWDEAALQILDSQPKQVENTMRNRKQTKIENLGHQMHHEQEREDNQDTPEHSQVRGFVSE